MFFIYSLTLEDLSVKLHDFCRTKDTVTGMLDTVATAFIRREEGDRRAEKPYRTDIDAETETGYFLVRSDQKQDQIDVYLRKTELSVGRVWNSYETSCQKVMHFAVTEASLGLPTECTGKGVTLPTFSTAMESQQHADHMDALKARLVAQRQKVDAQIARRDGVAPETLLEFSDSEEDLISDSDFSESDYSEEITENPVQTLRRRVEFDTSNTEAELDILLRELSEVKMVTEGTLTCAGEYPIPQNSPIGFREEYYYGTTVNEHTFR